MATAIKASGVARERLFITTKISMDGTETKALDKIKTDLQQLGTDYADLVLLHAPEQIGPQWAALEEALEMNLTRSIGISNFNANQMAVRFALHPGRIIRCVAEGVVKRSANTPGLAGHRHSSKPLNTSRVSTNAKCPWEAATTQTLTFRFRKTTGLYTKPGEL